MMAYEWDNEAKPDILCVGKAISGGFIPVSGAFCNDNIMMNIKPGDHGSTFGGNPLAMAVAKVAIETLIGEGMIENAHKMGNLIGDELSSIQSPLIKETRGRGLLRAIELVHDAHVDGNDLVDSLLSLGLITRSAHKYTVRVAPALVITEKQVHESVKIFKEGLASIEKLNNERSAGKK